MDILVKMNNTPLVSVVIPVFNGEKHVRRAIESVANQTYQNMEIIIVDDGSTDNTPQIISAFIKKDPRIITITNETNFGFVKSLNKGIENSKGKYIARLDDDDVWSDNQKIEKQVVFLEKNYNYVLVGGGVIVKKESDDKEMIRYLFPENDSEIRKTLLVDNLFAHSAVVFLKSAFDKVGGYEERFGFFADRELWLKLGKVGKFYNFPEYFIHYSDKEANSGKYDSRNRNIRRKLALNIELRKKHSDNYPGFIKSVLLCVARYFYSFLPFRKKFWRIILKIRVLIFGLPAYKYSNPRIKPEM